MGWEVKGLGFGRYGKPGAHTVRMPPAQPRRGSQRDEVVYVKFAHISPYNREDKGRYLLGRVPETPTTGKAKLQPTYRFGCPFITHLIPT
ncbi:unnamed protein product [Protopolystoma xenopodis]|uniref:Uncharacterized protein n=1 Tax=Protopolystoma xenopodis TaxID=117903 RepID=A0A3S5BRH6_9PLAT|nr:unnamed protein product [Protopolystoma xenopodis]